ncbi:hypothetical protein JKI95_02010 [Corynebacterium aquatimens]|nr:hypothetical protein [Corynebacterium aquatimens]QYH19898.1 hypothetical protein JKI95_02010 [Corynebacterium aquatimens]
MFPVDKDSGIFTLENLLIPVAWSLGGYYIFILPIFYIRKHRWDKKHRE